MKKFLLLVLVLGIGSTLLAQKANKNAVKPHYRTIYEKPVIGIEPVKSPSIMQSEIEQKIPELPAYRSRDIVTVIDIGTSANAWSYGSNNVGNQKSLVWAEPELNIVTNFHRGGGELDPGGFSGDYCYDISFDGGMTWDCQKECYCAWDNQGGNDGDAARYPNHGIYNPTGNVDDAYVVFFGPNLDGSNSDEDDGWGGYSYGVANISDPSDTTGNYNRKTSHDDVYQHIPDAFDVTSQGMAIVVDKNLNWTQGAPATFMGNLIVNQGYWNDDEGDFVYEETLFEYDSPLDYGSPWFTSVAFAPDGLTGYIAVLGNNDETWKTEDMRHSIYPIFWKTTDGGESWEGPNAIQIDGPDGIGGIVYNLLTDERLESVYDDIGMPVPPRDETPYTFTGDFEIAVTADGNLHIAGVVGAAGLAESDGGISFYIGNEAGAVLDVFTDDGGNTWYAEEMGRVYQYDGAWGRLEEGNRTQITLSPDAEKVFISWLDNNEEDEEDNSNPHLWSRGFDPSTYMKTKDTWNYDSIVDGPTCVTLFSLGHRMAFLGTAAKTALELVEGEYTIPYTFVEFTGGDPDEPAQFKYIQDFSFSEADFLVTGINHEKNSKESLVIVSQNYPNPFSKQTSVEVSLNKGAELSLSVYTLTGQLILLNEYGYATKGLRTLTIDAAGLVPGIYFYTITVGESQVTRKMIVK